MRFIGSALAIPTGMDFKSGSGSGRERGVGEGAPMRGPSSGAAHMEAAPDNPGQYVRRQLIAC
jgi:hypothetical protein